MLAKAFGGEMLQADHSFSRDPGPPVQARTKARANGISDR